MLTACWQTLHSRTVCRGRLCSAVSPRPAAGEIGKCGTTVEWGSRFFKTGRCNYVTYLEYGVACCRLEQHQHLCTAESHNDSRLHHVGKVGVALLRTCVRVVLLRMRVHPFANKVWWRRVCTCVSWSVEVYWLEMRCLVATVCFLAAVVAAKPPNIVFMLMDDVS